MPGGRKELMEYLDNLGITSETTEHPAVFTVEAMMPYVGHLPGAHSKNLFLKDKKKKRLWLVTALSSREYTFLCFCGVVCVTPTQSSPIFVGFACYVRVTRCNR